MCLSFAVFLSVYVFASFQLAQEFTKFGSVDVKILDATHAVVAVAWHSR